MTKLKNKHKLFNLSYNEYTNTLKNKFQHIDLSNLLKATELILKTIKKNKCIYVCDNGGSDAIADHYICDFFKQLSKYTNLKAIIRSLNSDQYLISTISNDISYSEIFKIQAERYIKNGDMLILISSSGNSENIKKILNYCKKKD